MGSNTHTPDAHHRADRIAAASPSRWRRRYGFTNAALAGLLGLLALIGLLAMVQSGQLSLGAVLPAPAISARQSKAGNKGKAPQFYPRAPRVSARPASAGSEHPAPAAYQRQPRRELYQALAHMDADAAAKMLMDLDAAAATDLLMQLRERDLARILDAAPPVEAAQWVADLLDAAPPLELTPLTAQPAAVPAADEAAQSAAPAGAGTDIEANQGNTGDTSSQADPVSQDGADTDAPAADNGNAAGIAPLQLPPNSNTA